MTEDKEYDIRARRTYTDWALGALTLGLGTILLSTAGVAGPASRSDASELRIFVASSTPLPASAMEQQTGTGMAPTIIMNDQGAGPRVQLWDELKIRPLMAPPTSGMTTGGNVVK